VNDGRKVPLCPCQHVHEKDCPASQSVQRGIAIEWDGEVVEDS
jgi:hypothetical protein